jgi:hypothetical protein
VRTGGPHKYHSGSVSSDSSRSSYRSAKTDKSVSFADEVVDRLSKTTGSLESVIPTTNARGIPVNQQMDIKMDSGRIGALKSALRFKLGSALGVY